MAQTQQGEAQPSPAAPAQAQNARRALERLETRAQENPEDVNAWLDLGQAYLERNRLEEAKASFLEAVALDYLSADAHFGLGLAEYLAGNYSAALFEFSEVARLFPERFDGHFNRGVTLAQLDRAEEAVAAFQEAILQAGPEAGREARANAYLGLAGQLKVLGRFDEAADAYTSAISLRGRTPELTYLRAEALYRAGRGLEALPNLRQLEAAGGDERVSALVADIYAQAGQPDYALHALTRARRRAAQAGRTRVEANLLIQLGLLQRSLGRDRAAARSFREAAALDPASGEAFYNLGVSYLESGQPELALGPLNNALRAQRGRGEIYLALAAAYDQLGQPDEARRRAEAAAQRLEGRLKTDATFLLGRALYSLGDYRGALLALQEVAQARPNDAQAQLWAGLAHYQQGNYDRAVERYERAVQLDPNSAEARVNLGAAYLASQRFEDAELVYELLTEQYSEDADAYYNLGWSLFSQGRGAEARQAWERAAELGYEPAQTALSQYF